MNKGKVWVGLSGGVDSSTSAALLKEEGYDVTGVFIKVWQPDFLTCTWEEDRTDAMRVCAHLDIPFKTLDLEETYYNEVVQYMIDGYKNGETPNPDVMCNKEVKFGAFLKEALKEGVDFVATGHYAQNLSGNDGHELHKGLDQNKDQSYFLWTLTEEQLNHTLFPVGGMEKKDVRKIAEKFGLITAEKKDSQGLCFLGKLDMQDFLKHFITGEKGSVLSVDGKVIGEHEGAVFYTLGQRHGFTVKASTPEQRALYVVERNIKENTVTVSDTPLPPKKESEIKLRATNWISYTPKIGNTHEARLRYRGELFSVTFKEVKGHTVVLSLDSDRLIPKGQSLVLYEKGRCLGGGIITT